MALTKTPYEFLVRFNPDGSVSGAHIKFLETFTEGVEVIMRREGMAEPVAMAGQLGFPLSDVLDAVQVGALAAIEAEKTASAEALAAKDAEIAALKAQIPGS